MNKSLLVLLMFILGVILGSVSQIDASKPCPTPTRTATATRTPTQTPVATYCHLPGPCPITAIPTFIHR